MERRHNADVMVQTIALAGKQVIDVGCGDGGWSRLMAKHGATVLGVECGQMQLAKARAWQAANGPAANVTIVQGVGQDLPVADGMADLVVFFNSLHHIPAGQMAPALAQAHRVLKPGGHVFVTEPVAEGPHFQACRPVDDETTVRALAYQALTQAPGFRMEQEFFYLHQVRHQTYEAFRDRIIAASEDRKATFLRMDQDMRALFAQTGIKSDDGWLFDQPMRANLLVKV